MGLKSFSQLSKKAKEGLDRAVNMSFPIFKWLSDNVENEDALVDTLSFMSQNIKNESLLMEFFQVSTP
jgi:hypothetical protein